MSKAANEKRKHPRVGGKNVAAHVNFADRSTPCRIQNISAGGMLVESEEPLPAGIPVAVNLAQPGWTRALRLPGRVVWALAPKAAAKKGKTPGMRIRFDPLEPDTADMLLELLHTLGIGETPPPERVLSDTLPPQNVAPPRRPSLPQTPGPATPVGAPSTRTFRGAPQIDGPPTVVPTPAQAPRGAPDTRTLPGSRTQELSLNDIVAHISKVDVPAVTPPRGKKKGEDATILNTVPAPSADVAKLTTQVKGLKLQLDELQRALEERERELAAAHESLEAKQLALDKADRERRAAETAIQRLSMQLASRR